MITTTKEHSYVGPRDVKAFKCSPDKVQGLVNNLQKFGVGIGVDHFNSMYSMYKEDMSYANLGRDSSSSSQNLGGSLTLDAALTPPLTTPSIGTPEQFLQTWLPGQIHYVTSPRKIDLLTGVSTIGRWEDEKVVLTSVEYVGNPSPYGDYTNIPESSWNANYETRSVVRFEEGLSVGRLEEARAAGQMISSAATKRLAASMALEIIRNRIGFFGFNNGNNRTFGFLNDPGNPAYVNVPSATAWSSATYLQITGDIRSWYAGLRIQSRSVTDPGVDKVTLALATSVYDFLTVTPDFGNSVMQWLRESYPNTRVINIPEFDAANGGENVAFLYAESVQDNSTDNNRTYEQCVPAKFQTLGVEQKSKRYIEDYTNATAGVILKRPFLVYAATGM